MTRTRIHLHITYLSLGIFLGTFIGRRQPLLKRKKELHGGCHSSGPKVAKFLDR
jgi:hypothetical protein